MEISMENLILGKESTIYEWGLSHSESQLLHSYKVYSSPSFCATLRGIPSESLQSGHLALLEIFMWKSQIPHRGF